MSPDDHPRFPDYDSAAVGAAMLQAMLPSDLVVNIHPMAEPILPVGCWFELSVSHA